MAVPTMTMANTWIVTIITMAVMTMMMTVVMAMGMITVVALKTVIDKDGDDGEGNGRDSLRSR